MLWSGMSTAGESETVASSAAKAMESHDVRITLDAVTMQVWFE